MSVFQDKERRECHFEGGTRLPNFVRMAGIAFSCEKGVSDFSGEVLGKVPTDVRAGSNEAEGDADTLVTHPLRSFCFRAVRGIDEVSIQFVKSTVVASNPIEEPMSGGHETGCVSRQNFMPAFFVHPNHQNIVVLQSVDVVVFGISGIRFWGHPLEKTILVH